jgi:hypothetical protein
MRTRSRADLFSRRTLATGVVLNVFILAFAQSVFGEEAEVRISVGRPDSPGAFAVTAPEQETCTTSTLAVDKEMLPSVTTTMDGAITSICNVTAQCFFGAQVLPNCTVTFTLRAVPYSGSHDHHDENRPAGSIVFTTPRTPPDVTGPNGEPVEAKYTAPEEAGLIEITGSGECTPCPPLSDDQKIYAIKTSGVFAKLGPGVNYRLVGTTSEIGQRHLDNHYGTAGLVRRITLLAEAYATVYPGKRLDINDMSLPWGGLFDLGPGSGSARCTGMPGAYWKPPHCWHRSGIDADINLVLPPVEREAFRAFAADAGSFLEPVFESDHTHLR